LARPSRQAPQLQELQTQLSALSRISDAVDSLYRWLKE